MTTSLWNLADKWRDDANATMVSHNIQWQGYANARLEDVDDLETALRELESNRLDAVIRLLHAERRALAASARFGDTSNDVTLASVRAAIGNLELGEAHVHGCCDVLERTLALAQRVDAEAPSQDDLARRLVSTRLHMSLAAADATRQRSMFLWANAVWTICCWWQRNLDGDDIE